jgi:hypothetical protein
VHHSTAREIEAGETPAQRGVEQAALAPDHVGHGAVDNQRPQNHEQQHGPEFHALGKCAGDERGRDDGEHQLVDHEGLERDGRRIVAVGLRTHAPQEDVVQATDEAVAGAEGEAVADNGPKDRNHGHHGKTLDHGSEDVLFAHQAAVEEREARSGHHQHECGAGEHPGVVSGGFGIGGGGFQFCKTGIGAYRRGLRDQAGGQQEGDENKAKHQPIPHQGETPGQRIDDTPKSKRSLLPCGNRNYLWKESGNVMGGI